MIKKIPSIAEMRKALVAVAGVLAQVIALGILNGQVLNVTQVLLAVITAVLVYTVRNKDAPVKPVSGQYEVIGQQLEGKP